MGLGRVSVKVALMERGGGAESGDRDEGLTCFAALLLWESTI